jgi:hypothetical protein
MSNLLDQGAQEAYVGDYSYVPGGITNQKLGLFGLMMQAAETGVRRFVLPDLLIFDQAHNHSILVDPKMLKHWSEYYDLDALREFMTEIDVAALEGPKITGKFGWPYYRKGVALMERAGIDGALDPDHIVCRFVRSLVPMLRMSDFLSGLKRSIFTEGNVRVVAQLRIEADWKRFVQQEWHPDDHTYFDIVDVVRRIGRGLNVDRCLVCCDERHLPAPKAEIKEMLVSKTGILPLFKSDFIAQEIFEGLNPLDLSLIDFELAFGADTFVGLSSSTFSSAITLERYAQRRVASQSDYIYDVPGPGIANRTDNGAFYRPQLAAKEYYWERQRNFWLAQTHAIQSGNSDQILRLYRSRLELADECSDEYFVSAYRVAQLLAEAGAADADVIEAFEVAIRCAPHRAEPYHGLSRYLRFRTRYTQGFEAARRALGIPQPSRGMFIEHWIYEYGLLDEFAVNAFWTAHYKECAEACDTLLACRSLPEEYHGRISENARLARVAINKAELQNAG